MSLEGKSCRACAGYAAAMNDVEAAGLLQDLNGWNITNGHLFKNYPFKDFVQPLNAANRIGGLAEEEGHHPDLHISWGGLGVEIWTHRVNGLTESDFILASKIDRLFHRKHGCQDDWGD